MSVHFTQNRLHVGYRLKDWSDVWYQLIGEPDEEGEAAIGLYKLTTGGPGLREPMDGEVVWHGPFDVKRCESSKARERESLQKQFLTDAYRYLAEKDPENVRQMEEDLDDPGFSRWQAWFRQAKKWKKKQMAERTNRRRRRGQKAIELGVNETEVEDYINSDSSDSAYESEGLERLITKTRVSEMRPPKQRPTKTGGKRTATNCASSSHKSNAKKAKPSADGPSRRPNRRQGSSPLFVSGGLRSLGNSAKNSVNSSSNGYSDDDDDDYDYNSDDYDIRPPQGLKEEVARKERVDEPVFPTPRSIRDRAGDRDITPFAQWGPINQEDEKGLQGGIPGTRSQPRAESPLGDDAIERANRISDFSGAEMDGGQAMQEGLRQSMTVRDQIPQSSGNDESASRGLDGNNEEVDDGVADV